MIGIFEKLPNELIEHIFKNIHQTNMKDIHKFIKKYVPDPYETPDRFISFHTSPKFIKTSSRIYSLNPVGKTCFFSNNTMLETLFIYHLISR
jgi:hypothetical protein